MSDQTLMLLFVLLPSLIVWSFILWQNRPRSDSQQPAWGDNSQWLKEEDRDWLRLQGVDVSLIPPNPETIQAEHQSVPRPERKPPQRVHSDGFEWPPPSRLFEVRTTLIKGDPDPGPKGDPGPDPVNAKVPSYQLRPLEHYALSTIRNRCQALSDVMKETTHLGYKVSDDFADQVELLCVTAKQFRDVIWHGYRNSTREVKELAADLARDSEILRIKVSKYRAGYTHRGHSDFSLF